MSLVDHLFLSESSDFKVTVTAPTIKALIKVETNNCRRTFATD